MEKILIIGIFFSLLCSELVNGGFQLQNVVCESFDPSISEFSRCEMKIVQRGVSAFYMIWKWYKKPINNFNVNLSFHKKSNGYLPFLFNQTLDYCYYMRNPKAHPLIYMMHKPFLPVSNINHSCPYDHDVIINGFIFKENDMRDLPISNGEYMIQVKIATDKNYIACIRTYVKKM
ncbi:uncharacterized protein LOC119555236 [Drosophila subpulchrella]|uniref:uncharacterized protein LOC119555236 n=1 Tax=Drosophila subpulchrella TaxID=1486046 RepID=UPI0018A14CE6|nr:uncharacterized protein LOC119555236 [Drosophila subpulchrella]